MLFSPATTALARSVHSELVGRPQDLIIVGDGPGYLAGTALTEFDGSSKYVMGGLAMPLILRDHPAEYEDKVDPLQSQIAVARFFTSRQGLRGNLFVASHHAGPGRFLTAISPSPDKVLVQEHAWDAQNVEAQDHATRLTLEHLARHLGIAPERTHFENHLDDQNVSQNVDLQTIRDVNQAAARAIVLMLEEDPALHLLVGESFTFGKIAALLGGVAAHPEFVALSYGWYHPHYKRAMGVDPQQLTDGNIAEPETVLQGARGLLRHASSARPVTLATSGWANNSWLGDRVDFFSVAAATPQNQMALRYRVTSTADFPINRVRRSLTRELGVTAALRLLTALLPGDIQDLQVQSTPDHILRSYGELSFIERL